MRFDGAGDGALWLAVWLIVAHELEVDLDGDGTLLLSTLVLKGLGNMRARGGVGIAGCVLVVR